MGLADILLQAMSSPRVSIRVTIMHLSPFYDGKTNAFRTRQTSSKYVRPEPVYHDKMEMYARLQHESTMKKTVVKIPQNPCRLERTSIAAPSSSKYHTTIFKVPHNPLQSTTQPSSK